MSHDCLPTRTGSCHMHIFSKYGMSSSMNIQSDNNIDE